MDEPIVVVGSACRFPGAASSPSKLWNLLQNPQDILSQFSPERLRLSNFYNTNGEHHGSTNVKNKSYLLSEDINLFDASFFNVNPLEAHGMDPQQRILLETVYEALECAGQPLEKVQGSQTSVFVGLMNADYYDIQLRDPETMPRYNATGTARSILSNRISYFFDLKGPSMTIDTACSSSLVALHQAVLSLRNGESKSAIVAGANLLLDPMMYIAESTLHMLSPEARSRMWDKSADGYARGEGFAAIILKPLSDALRDGDQIECVVRGSGVNSDGRTTGITMPSSAAQTELILRTYRDAGLDPVADRPQFVECHGTGTAAGDPVEARAIRDAFFPENAQYKETMYVGSIKTIIGHLEGCAGLAGVLKAMLAMKHRTIPPNMHFETLNPAIANYYTNLRITKKALPWPETGSVPLRASVNSFGFGGTNAHVVLEAYTGTDPQARTSSSLSQGTAPQANENFVGPLVFSAASQSSLRGNIEHFLTYLELHPSLDLKDLSWTLQKKRSTLPVRAFFSGSTRDHLLHYMETAVAASETGDIGTRAPPSAPNEQPAILGIFTGQGAQWATMGRMLIQSSPLFRRSIERCEDSLARLPEPPEWSLAQELMVDQSASRIQEAAFSQPLCTALQVALVDLLEAAGIRFHAVVGHSSGEIAAAYAAGIISAEDAIRIAYYRGLYAKFACGAEQCTGSMMAVGMSMEGAIAFCDQPSLKGRIGLAASNSPSSVTLSGDKDAIEEAKTILDEQKTFARLLKVDTAYHSHHMLPCSARYLEALAACRISVRAPRSDCTWISSVRGDTDLVEYEDLDSLAGQYWVDNMVQPVLFSQAVEGALWTAGPFDMVLEVGPHPALKGPAVQTFKSVLGAPPAYVGLLRRETNEVEAFSGGIGYVWSHLARSPIDFDSYRRAFVEPTAPHPKLLQDLPGYAWVHDKPYWRESRVSKQFRLRDSPPHQLLGRRAPDDSEFELRWRNILKLGELQWLHGHEFQGDALFPATGYIAMALEAAKAVTEGNPVRLIEIENFEIHQAVVIKDGHSGIETIFTLKKEDEGASHHNDKTTLVADFSCYVCLDESTKPVVKSSSGRIILHFGGSSTDILPPRPVQRANLSPLDRDMFYESLAALGLNYHGLFKPDTSFKRCLNYATGHASWKDTDIDEQYSVHPALMDVGLHSIFVAYASPVSKALWSTYLPTSIHRLSFNPLASFRNVGENVSMDMDCFITDSSSKAIEGNIHIFDPSGMPAILIENIRVQAFAEAKKSDDRQLFTKTVWDFDVANGFPIEEADAPLATGNLELGELMERVSFYFARVAVQNLGQEDVKHLRGHFKQLYSVFIDRIRQVEAGNDPIIRTEWMKDSRDHVDRLMEHFPSSVDLEMLRAVGTSLEAVFKGDTQLIEVVTEHGLLDRFYEGGRLFVPLNQALARAAKWISHKHPSTKILEIGAGTGATTRSILDSIGDRYSSYTYTDISAGFFGKAEEKFSEHRHKMKFQTLDIAKNVDEQGYKENHYDVIVAANVLHATSILQETMEHVRSLLKPGGYLLLVETTGVTLQLTYVMGGFSAWWFGVNDGRAQNPGISLIQWEDLLEKTGFSGVRAAVSDLSDTSRHSCSAIIAQAVDNKINILRDPLPSLQLINVSEPILIIGGTTLSVAKMVRDISKMLQPFKDRIQIVNHIDTLEARHVAERSFIICLTELDEPLLYRKITQSRLKKLQQLMSVAANMLWLTNGRLSNSPHSNMVVGLARTLRYEVADINCQFLDVQSLANLTASIIVEKFVQLIYGTSSEVAKSDLLWNVEPELVYDGSTWSVPRVIPYDTLNDRYNAARRPVTKRLETIDQAIDLCIADGLLSLKENCWLPKMPRSGTTRINVRLSTCLHLEDAQSFNLCAGSIHGTDDVALCLSAVQSSVVDVPESDVLILPRSDCTDLFLQVVSSHIIGFAIWSCAPAKGRTLFYEPDQLTASALRDSPARRQREIVFASSADDGAKANDGWLYFHPRTADSAIELLLPQDVTKVIDLSPQANFGRFSSSKLLGAAVTAQSCLARFLTTQVSLGDILTRSYKAAVSSLSESPTPGLRHTRKVQDLATGQPRDSCFPNTVDWTSVGPLTAHVSTLDARGLFSPEKTYLMIGLNSELGLSICRWMITNGARHIAITSRRGKVNERWLQEVTALEARVEVYSMDVTIKQSVHSVYETICQTMPPVAGVCNGAMVLSDKLFMHMGADDLNTTFMPKVEGSMYLDELFSQKSLDFFILFSSLASVVGNGGQANYHAANMFMTSLAAQRRARGLAASVIHIGLVVDVGYVARTGQALIDHLVNLFYAPLSETDIHQLFAEAVIASPIDSQLSHDIVMGVEPVHNLSDAIHRPPWYNNPVFSHLRREYELSETKKSRDSRAVAVRDQIDGAQSTQDAMVALVQVFARKLEAILHLPSESANMHVPLLDLGMDSLLAVEVRQWFSAELDVDVPVLKLLSGDTGAEMCEDVLQKYAAKAGTTSKAAQEIIPSVARSDDIPVERTIKIEEPDRAGSATPSSILSTTDESISLRPSSITTVSPDDKPLYLNMDNFKRSGKMSYSQTRLWLQDRLYKDPTSLNIAAAFKLEGNVNIARLRQAVQSVVSRHETLHSCYFDHPDTSEPTQGVLRSPPQRFTHIDASDNDLARAVFVRMQEHIWDLSRGDTMQVILVSSPFAGNTLIVGYHHIVMDGVSWHMFLRTLSEAYELQTLKPIKAQALEFAVDEITLANSDTLKTSVQYWTQKLTPLPEVFPLLSFSRVKGRRHTDNLKAHTALLELNPDIVAGIKKASQGLRATPFHFYLTAMQSLFFKLSGLTDLCIGVADANRGNAKFASTVGFFLNTMALRFQIDDEQTFSHATRQTTKTVLSALENSAVPIELVLDELNVPRSSTHSPLFQLAFNYRLGEMVNLPLGDCSLELQSSNEARSAHDFVFSITESKDGQAYVQVSVRDSLYREDVASMLCKAYASLLKTASKEVEFQIKDLAIDVPLDETKQVTPPGFGPRTDYAWPDTLVEKFDQVLGNSQEIVAVRCGKDSLTYSQLSQRANTILNAIINKGVSAGSCVAVMLQPSTDLVASILAVLRARCVYVPVDQSLPEARQVAILRSCSAALVLCSSQSAHVASKLCPVPDRVMNISLPLNSAPGSHSRISHKNSPAFLLYTSGSTGVPKGIVLSDRGFVNLLAHKAERLSLGREIVLQQSSPGFDMSIAQIFSALVHGGTLVIVPQNLRGDALAISKLMADEKVSFTIGTPSEYLMYLQYGGDHLRQYSGWRNACLGGEAVTMQLRREFQHLSGNCPVLTDCYGPTEISLCTTFTTVDLEASDVADEDYHTVGKAIPNSSIYIVDSNGRQIPTGLTGEICVSGAGLALEYWNMPDFNSQKFVEMKTVTPSDRSLGWTKMYRTGDLGRLTDDGSLIFMGRLDGDAQIKLRGLRIDLEDVAACLLRSSNGLLSEAIVTARGDPAFLVAHVVASSGSVAESIDLKQLRRALALPQYMCPSQIVLVESLPRTTNGKIDRRAIAQLSLPEQAFDSQVEARGLSLAEGELRLVWDNVLHQSIKPGQLGPEDDFFMVGGNSFLLVKLQSAIKAAYGLSLSLKNLYHSSTLATMAVLVNAEKSSQPGSEIIDWDIETAFHPSALRDTEANFQKSSKPDNSSKEILLTGATSFLGSEILKSLLQQNDVNKVHCIAVDEQYVKQIPGSDKISIYPGSLHNSTLGLTRAEIEKLRSRIDLIIHAGSSGHCLNNYNSLRAANLSSTRFLAELALSRRIPIDYLSSSRVTLLSGSQALPPGSVFKYHPSTDGSEGFTDSKWASERYLENVAKTSGLPIRIHRACAVTGDSAPSEDALNAILRYSTLLQALPQFSNFQGYFDFKDVRAVATEFVQEALAIPIKNENDTNNTNSSTISFRHYSSGVKVPVDKIKEHMEVMYECEFQVVPLKDWIDIARPLGIEALIISYLEAVESQGHALVLPYMGETTAGV